jgi:hypothetical protein
MGLICVCFSQVQIEVKPSDEPNRECANCRVQENDVNGVHLMECGQCKVRAKSFILCDGGIVGSSALRHLAAWAP